METTTKESATKGGKKTAADNEKAATQSKTHKTYEEYKVEVERIKKSDGSTDFKYEKVKHIKDVLLEPYRADALNRRASDTKIYYYEKA